MEVKNNLISVDEAEKNFGQVIGSVEKNGYAVIMQDDIPKYIVSKFDSKIYDEKAKAMIAANMVLSQHDGAFKELAK